MSTFGYRLYGLRVQSEIALGERRWAGADPPDVRITLSPDRHPGELDGPSIASQADGERLLYRVVRSPSGACTVRAEGLCDFWISAARDAIRCVPVPGRDHALLPVLLRGTVMAVLLELRNRTTLHASAVQLDGRVVGLAGVSGAGKTTTAALLCVAGAKLVTDDVLAVELDTAGGPTCAVGSNELRLRPAAVAMLADTGWRASTRPVADGRLAVRPAAAAGDRSLPLSAIVFPRPDRTSAEVALHRVEPSDALFRLVGVPRIQGWSCEEVLTRTFEDLTVLADRVPVYEAFVPWGPPWRPDEARRVVDSLERVPA